MTSIVKNILFFNVIFIVFINEPNRISGTLNKDNGYSDNDNNDEEYDIINSEDDAEILTNSESDMDQEQNCLTPNEVAKFYKLKEFQVNLFTLPFF